MKVAIATTGRFHVLDLARELSALGHDVAFYSYVPRSRAARFGLPVRCHRPLLPRVAAWLVMSRAVPVRRRVEWDRRLMERVDRLVARELMPCDVFIGMSGLCVESAKAARGRYGAQVLIERGSRHICSQKEILEKIAQQAPGASTVPDYAVERELASYAEADLIVVPSRHVVDSFVERGFPEERLFRNPYGVDLAMFGPTPAPPIDRPVLLHVGAWSMQKGCDLLAEAVRQSRRRLTLLHVGPLADAASPRESWFEHQEPVPQWKLPDFYARAHVLAMPSRQDGFGLVLAQALACGLPVVASDRTGADDLRELLTDSRWVVTVPHDDVGALRAGIDKGIDMALRQNGPRQILDSDSLARFSWRRYAERYEARLSQLLLATA